MLVTLCRSGGPFLLMVLCGCSQILQLDDFSRPEGGEVPTGRCGGLGVLADDFRDGKLTPNWYELFDQDLRGSFLEQDGEAVLEVQAGAGGRAERTSLHLHDMRDDSVTLEVLEVPAEGTFYFMVRGLDDEPWLAFEAGEMGLRFRSDSGNLDSEPWDEAAHRYWRIREQGGDIMLETAPDVAGEWTRKAAASATTLFDPAYVRVAYGLTVNSTSDGVRAVLGSLNGGEATQQWCKAHTLTDPFDDGVTGDIWLRSRLSDCEAKEEGGKLVVINLDGNRYCDYQSSRGFDLTGSSFSFRVDPGADPPEQHYMRIASTGLDNIEIQTFAPDSKLNFVETIDDDGRVEYTTALAPEKTRWRASERNGEFVFERSADGANWEQVHSFPPAFPLDAVSIGFGIWDPQPGASATFSELNTARR